MPAASKEKSGPFRDQSGFSLLEVLVAFSILALVLGALLQVFSGGLRNAALAEEYSHATLLAEAMLSRAGKDIPLEAGEYGEETDAGYRWQMRIAPYVVEGLLSESDLGLYRIEVTVSWESGNDRRAVSLTRLELGGESG